MNWKLIRLFFSAAAAFVLTGCLKENQKTFTDFSKAQPTVILQGSGVTNFKATNIQLDPSSTDTLRYTITVALASSAHADQDIPVTIGIDNAEIAAYNAAHGTNFQAFNSNQFKLLNTTVTIPKGQNYASTTLEVYQANIDPTKSWLLPIKITDAKGRTLTSNQNILYYNVIGNPLAGTYHWDFTRYNNSDGSGPPNSLSFKGETTVFVPASPTMIEVQSGYYIGPRYQLSFTNNNGVLSNFSLKFNDEDITAMANGGVTITSGPVIQIADPVNRIFQFQFVANTASGPRYIIDRYYP